MTIIAKKIDLSHLAEIFAGHPFRAQIHQNLACKTAVVRTRDVSEFSAIAWDQLVRTEIKGRGEPNWLKVNDLLFPSRGASLSVYRVDEKIEKMQVVADPNFFVLRLKSSEVRADYLEWWLNQKPTQLFFEQQAQGSVIRCVSRGTLLKTVVMLPPLEVQKKIVALAEMRNAEMKLLEQKKQNTEHLMQGLAENFLKICK